MMKHTGFDGDDMTDYIYHGDWDPVHDCAQYMSRLYVPSLWDMILRICSKIKSERRDFSELMIGGHLTFMLEFPGEITVRWDNELGYEKKITFMLASNHLADFRQELYRMVMIALHFMKQSGVTPLTWCEFGGPTSLFWETRSPNLWDDTPPFSA